ncbi:MAG TPA: T9SS type A sorting domain-containing protein, partial [Flavobacterium sp.]|nr:T9SS type A sorting domain-containing protein [Flavobacterium sp.]
PFAIGEDAEGYSCMTTPPIIPYTTKGTIMSYCHLVSGVGINLANGFGTQPKAAIAAEINGGACLSTDCVNTCINTVASITSTVTNNSITVSWLDIGSGTSWQVAVFAYSTVFPTWVTVTSPTYTKTGLLPNTFYKIRVRPVCSAGLTPAYRQATFATNADWCSGITITDTGGASGNYTDMQSYTRTLIPNLPNKKITLAFTAFDLELDYDYLYIYDGANTSATDLSAGGFTGDTNPGTFASSSPDGALTVKFYSDQGVVAAGYVATVGCDENLGVADLQDIDFTYYPNPANGFVNIISKTDITEILVYNPEGRLLYQSKNNGMEKKVDISAFATGTYFFKLKFGDKQANFKILKN